MGARCKCQVCREWMDFKPWVIVPDPDWEDHCTLKTRLCDACADDAKGICPYQRGDDDSKCDGGHQCTLKTITGCAL